MKDKERDINVRLEGAQEDIDITIEGVLAGSIKEAYPIPDHEPEYLDQPPSTHLTAKKDKLEINLIDNTKKEEVKKDPKTMAEDAISLAGRLETWNGSCRDLFLDLRTITFTATDEDMFIECNDKDYYPKPLYFKTDPQKPKDPKTVQAQKQFCKQIGIPHSFFMNNRPQLKMDIVKTWQAGLGADKDKGRGIVRFRESPDYCVLRAIVPETYALIQNYEIIRTINDTFIKVDGFRTINDTFIKVDGSNPNVLEFAYGDERDDLTLHARYLSGQKFQILDSDVCVGFSVIASELGASPLIVEALLHHIQSRTAFIASYGAESFLTAKYEGIQPQEIKELFPKLIERITQEIPEMKARIENLRGTIDPEETCEIIASWKGLPSKFQRALFHEVSTCPDDMKTMWDFARHMSLIAKDFDSLKRLQIERAAGQYLNLMFSKQ